MFEEKIIFVFFGLYYFRFNLSACVRKSLNDVFAKICCDQELRPDYSFGKAIWEPALKEATLMQTLDHQVPEMTVFVMIIIRFYHHLS